MKAGTKTAVDEDNLTISHTELEAFTRKLLEKVGVSREEAAIVADVMVTCDCKGMESHGVRWMDIYLKRLTAGSMKPVTNLKVVREKPSLLLLDAQNGLGMVAFRKAIEMGIEKAKTSGICAVGVTNSNHCGALGYYAEIAGRARMASMLMTNAAPLMAPWGGVTLCLGTNPICFGFPTYGDPVIGDMATSASARGKIFVAFQKGTNIPDGIALNKNGEPTTDPKEALEGILLPVGGPKGYSLALAIDIMAGIMTGSNFGQNIPSLHGEVEQVQNIGQFAVLFNIDDFLPIGEFLEKMDDSRRQLKRAQPAKGFSEVCLPGEIEAKTLRERREKGAVIPMGTWNLLQSWAKKLNVQ
jgi:LDH2 family malate/lactate/ureidoglycolate dehydrogenase